MSVILVKVDREKKTQSIWSDGIMVSGDMVSGINTNKIRHLSNKDYEILIGTTGDMLFGIYVRMNFMEKFEASPITDFTDADDVSMKLQEIYTELWHEFCDEKSVNYKADFTAQTLLVINGHICLMEMYEENVIGAHFLASMDNYAIGMCSTAARAMMNTGKLTANEIIYAISDVCTLVNKNVRSITDIKYKEI